MNKLIAMLIVMSSIPTFATDSFTYCLNFLDRANNTLGFNEDFTFTQRDGYEILKNPVSTIDLTFAPTTDHQALENYRIIDRDTKLDRKSNIETEIIRVGHTETTTRNNGQPRSRDVIDYVMKIKRSADGKIQSISKRPGFLETSDSLNLIFPEEVNFGYNNSGSCYPKNYNQVARPFNNFNTDLCRDLQEFYDQNPAAQHCIREGYGNKLARILLSYKIPGFQENWLQLNNFRQSPDVKAIQEIGKCDNYKLTDLVTDKTFWGHADNATPVTLESNTIRQ